MEQGHTHWADDDTPDAWPSDAEIEADRVQAQARVDELDALFSEVQDDPRVVRVSKRCESIQLSGELNARFRAYCAGDVAAYLAVTPGVHAAAQAQAAIRSTARAAMLSGVRATAERIESETPALTTSVASRARRAVADLSGRLHGLNHTCLLAGRVSTAQAATVASL